MPNILDNYHKFQQKTENGNFDLKYMSIGLAGEVGEFLNEIKKMERDDNNILTEIRKQKIILELGDILWYLTGVSNKLNLNLNDIINNNIIKLNNRNKQD